jgi:septum formation inhibitor-activating ATPase MinD
VAEDLNIPFVGRIPIDPAVSACGNSGEPFIISLPQSVIAGAMRDIGRRCRTLMDQRGRLTLVTQLVYKD